MLAGLQECKAVSSKTPVDPVVTAVALLAIGCPTEALSGLKVAEAGEWRPSVKARLLYAIAKVQAGKIPSVLPFAAASTHDDTNDMLVWFNDLSEPNRRLVQHFVAELWRSEHPLSDEATINQEVC